ncbi:hypothetical protein [Flavobacterium enshiense]|uniref:hypothetical protein n=1 Tax=Flavobacterium enshiense TaxID=1341165 RepID=UPI0006870914|nr:hypothetical protein [Flavobacterium enshiense]
MRNACFFTLVFLLHYCAVYGQLKKDRFVFGFAYGTGEELKNNDYTYTNSFYKFHVGFEAILLKEVRNYILNIGIVVRHRFVKA